MCNCPPRDCCKNCGSLPWMHVTQPYSCPNPCPGYLAEPYHLPGYTGHIPTYKTERIGGSFGKLSHDVLEDPFVAQAPIPILQPKGLRCCLDTPCGNDDSKFVPRDCKGCCDRASDVYRKCEPLCASYAGHTPGIQFHNLGRSIGKASFGTKAYMDKCLYYNTFSVK